MINLESILNTTPSRALLMLATTGVLLLPGPLLIACYRPQMFYQMGEFRLLLMGAGLVFPVWFGNACMVFASIKRLGAPEDRTAAFTMLLAAWASVIPLYTPIFFHLFFGLNSAWWGILVLLISEIICQKIAKAIFG